MPNHEVVATSPLMASLGAAGRAYVPGEVLARRYRVVRFIARGGMGEVYEVEDQHLGVRVALKTIRPEAGLDARMLERFKREVLLARQVTHPNVCRIFDLGAHEEEGCTPVVFLTMELLAGETLAERLRRGGAMAPEVLLPVLRQVVSGLQAAHDAGVVHRDLKTGNLMLVPLSGGGERVVITDFGLARHVEGTGDHASTVAAMVGTPAYMAPEQVEGSVAGPAADVYALGVVLYEALTGERPFCAETPVYEALKRLNETPAPPSSKVKDLPLAWERAVMRCLARRPADRFARVSDVVEAVTAPAPAVTPGRRWPLAVAAAVALAAVTSVVLWQLGRRVPTSAAHPAQARRCVAVLGFQNLAQRPDAAWVAPALVEMLGSELAAGEQLRVLPGESVARLKSDLELPEGVALAPETLGRLRASVDVDVVVGGGYLASGDALRVDLHLQDADTGEPLATVIQSGSVARLADLASSAGAALRTRLGVGAASAEAAAAARAAFPASPEAARLYAEGVARLWVLDNVGAFALLSKAAATEPDHPMIHRALSLALIGRGERARAVVEARRAFETSAGLPRESRLAIEATYRDLNRERGRAVEIYTALHTFFPDNLEHGVELAYALANVGKPAEASAVLEELRKLPPPLGNDPRIDFCEAHVACSVPDLERCLAAARRTEVAAQARGARVVAARGQLTGGFVLWQLGRVDEARQPLEQSVAAFAALGDRFLEMVAANDLALVYTDSGELRRARAAFEQALAACKAVDNPGCAAMPLINLVLQDLNEGDLSRAEATGRESLAAAKEATVGTSPEEATHFATLNVVTLRTLQGRLAEARDLAERNLEPARQVGKQAWVARVACVLAEIDLAGGDVVAATRRARSALDAATASGDRRTAIAAGGVLARCGLLADDLAAAETALAAAVEVAERTGNRPKQSLLLVVRAEAQLARGDAAAAERTARETLTRLGDEPAVWVRAQAELALARALLGQGKLAAAREAAAEARRTAAASHVPQLGLEARTRYAEVDLAQGHANEAAATLGGVVDEARGLGMLALELEARVVLGRARLAQGRSAEGRAMLEAAASEAAAKGLARTARLARAAQNGT